MSRSAVLRSCVLPVALSLALLGCSGTGLYDDAAKDEALRAAGKDPFKGAGEVVWVGSRASGTNVRRRPRPRPAPASR